MPSASNIVIIDGAATPVAHTFVPLSITPALSTFVNRASAFTPEGFYTLGVSLNSATPSRHTYKVNLSIAVPVQVQDTDTGLYTVEDTTRCNVEFILPSNVAKARREDILAFCVNALQNVDVAGYVKDLEPVY